METPSEQAANGTPRKIPTQLAVFLTAATSGLVLVVEILAGRLLAPFVGVSLDTFTGIIGTILAGIALGAAVGGWLADRYEPQKLIAQALFWGGGLTWLSVPITSWIGPAVGNGPIAIVILSAAAFVAPTAVLSGVGPMVAKLELKDLDSSGAVVGKLSAASTFGALIGTFGTGFILIALLPVHILIFVIGALLVAGGIVMFVFNKQRPQVADIAAVIFTAILGLLATTPCQFTTANYCVQISVDDPVARPGGRTLILDQLRHAHFDLNDETHLEFRYMRLFADVAETLPDGPINVLHIGGGGFTLPRHIDAVRPGSTHTVLELDADLVEIVQAELGLPEDHPFDIRIGDARINLDELTDDTYDLVVGDAYSGNSVPWHLATKEVGEEINRVLKDDGVYMANIIDGDENRFVKSQLATLGETFDQLSLIQPATPFGQFAVNQIVIGSQQQIASVPIQDDDGRQLGAQELTQFIGNDAVILTDSFAPADQLLP